MVYLPRAFTEDRPPVLDRFIAEHAFATLVTSRPDGVAVSHVPLLWDAARRILTGHLARPNPQVAHLAEGAEALAIFHGPHAYVSPRWYRNHPAVPTWNYAVVHAHGRLRRIDDKAALAEIVDALARQFEAGEAEPWQFEDQPVPFRDGLLGGIVGFEIAVERLEGKFKLSQNRAAEDRQGVIAGLRRGGRPDDLALADLMAARETE